MQIQTLIVEAAAIGVGGATEESNTESNIEVAKPPVFNRKAGKVRGFITVCKLYLRMRMRGTMVKEQIQWFLSYM